jgi:sugar O-acyltransferase (sialic acid O-acetyltransferase NeuD family)
MKKELFIIGGSSTALEIFEAVQMGYKDAFSDTTFVIGDNEAVDSGLKTITDSEVREYVKGKEVSYIVSLTNHKLRLRLVETMEAEGLNPVNIIHPMAMVSPTAKMGVGIYMAAGAKVSVNATVANHCIINFDTTIGHDTVLKEHVMINPGVRVSGHVNIGARVLIGTNSAIFQGKTIGDDVIIDAMTYVKQDIESNMICTSGSQLKKYKRVL